MINARNRVCFICNAQQNEPKVLIRFLIKFSYINGSIVIEYLGSGNEPSRDKHVTCKVFTREDIGIFRGMGGGLKIFRGRGEFFRGESKFFESGKGELKIATQK